MLTQLTQTKVAIARDFVPIRCAPYRKGVATALRIDSYHAKPLLEPIIETYVST